MTLFNQLINLFESFIGIYFIDRLSDRKYKYRYQLIIIFTLISHLFVTLYDIYSINDHLYTVIDILIYFTFASITKKENKVINIFNVCLMWIILNFANSLALIIFRIIYLKHYPGITPVTIVVSKIIYFITIYYAAKILNNQQHYSNKLTWYVNIVLACLIIIHIELLEIIFKTMSLNSTVIIQLLVIMILSIVIVCIFKEYSKFQKDKHYLELELQHQKDNYQSLVENDKQIRKIQHDLKHVILSVIYSIQKNDAETALNLLNEKLNETSTKNVFDITNREFNFILNHYKDKFNESGIMPIVTNQMTITPLKTTDFFIVIGNLLDNAIENINSTNKKIIISTYQDDFETTIVIKNTYDPKRININGTSKKDYQNHGLGINNIRDILKTYNAIMLIDTDDLFYKCVIKIPNPKQQRD